MKNRIPYYIVYFFGFLFGYMSKSFWWVLYGIGSYVVFDYAFQKVMPKLLKLIENDIKKHDRN